MSQLKTNSITNIGNTGDANIELYADGSTSIRNLQNLSNSVIINGAMQVAQRGTSQTITTNTIQFPCVDRIRIELGGQTNPNYTYSQDSDAPPGFVNSFKIVNNANASQGSTGTIYNLIGTSIEQVDADQLAWGTADAKPVTVSFWVKSNVTGNNVVELIVRRDGTSSNDSIAGQITINAADTWEYKTIVFPGATTNTGRPADNALGFTLFFSFQGLVGGNRLPSYGTWDNNNRLGGPVGDTNVFASTSGAYMNITGLQLKAGSKATEFQHESYSETLAKCQRYYQNIQVQSGSYTGVYWGSASNSFIGSFTSFPVEMRATPANADLVSAASPFHWVHPGTQIYSANTTADVSISVSKNGWKLQQKRTAGGATPTNGSTYILEPQFYLGINAEL